ncbi:MAG: hypothetical protein KF687_09150 [Cyclobacteriaceae bacterium]|nr:hypothetical protein [Cyclobacteriaceae bacterium]
MLKPEITVKRRKNTSEVPYLNILERATKERTFLILIGLAFILAAFATFNGQVAMWFGFFFAAYAAVANDSIQSLGTFIESNKDKKWYILWLFTGLIMIGTIAFSYFYYNGDVTYQRLLNDQGNTKYPHLEQFSYFQIIAPVVLLVLTRLRMPVSTTFLMLSVFSADTSGITSIVGKSVSGYALAFIISFLIWYFGFDYIRKHFKKRKAHFGWTITQWIVSGSLWSVWLMQDGANIAVFLPRQLNLLQFLIFIGTIFFGLGILFYLRGDKIQEVVSEKVRISDIRAATLIDFTYVLLLIYKLFISTVPMSTTWVFLGTIGGREMAVSLSRRKKGSKHKTKAVKIIGRDFFYASIGLVISVALASGANPNIRNAIIEYFTGLFNL